MYHLNRKSRAQIILILFCNRFIIHIAIKMYHLNRKSQAQIILILFCKCNRFIISGSHMHDHRTIFRKLRDTHSTALHLGNHVLRHDSQVIASTYA